MKKGLQSGDKQFSLMLLSPAVIITVIFILVPVVDSIYRSFFDYKVKNIISGKPGTWNNFANYVKLFTNGKLPTAMTNTLLFVFGVVIAQFILGMALALVLNTNIRFSRFIRSFMMIPWEWRKDHRLCDPEQSDDSDARCIRCSSVETDPAGNSASSCRTCQCAGGYAGGG